MTRRAERRRECAEATEDLRRLKVGLKETLHVAGPPTDKAHRTMARRKRRIAVLEALLTRDQARADTAR